MAEKIEEQNKMEGKECEISHGGVFYSCVHDSCKKVASQIFTWFGLHSISELSSPETQNVATILILQCDRGRASDDISAVRSKYCHYNDKTIIILSLSIHDAEDHTKRYCTENMPGDGNITFLKIHQRANGHIHECRGNQFCRETVQSILGIAKQNDDLQNTDVDCAVVLNGLRQLVIKLQGRLQVEDIEHASSGLKNPSFGTDDQLVDMKSAEDKGTTGSSVLKFFSSKILSRSLFGSSKGPTFDHDTKEMLQKTEDYIKSLEKWQDKQSLHKVDQNQWEHVNPVGQEQDEEK